MIRRRLVVRRAREEGRWTLGSAGQAILLFDSRDEAVARAKRFSDEHPELELVVEDDRSSNDT